MRILNQPAPPPFKEAVRCAEQNLYVRAKELVGDRDPRAHEFSIQLRAFDSAKSGSGVGVGVLLALCSSLLQKSLKGGTVVAGSLNLGGSIETIYNPVSVVEIAIEKVPPPSSCPSAAAANSTTSPTTSPPKSPSTTTSTPKTPS